MTLGLRNSIKKLTQREDNSNQLLSRSHAPYAECSYYHKEIYFAIISEEADPVTGGDPDNGMIIVAAVAGVVLLLLLIWLLFAFLYYTGYSTLAVYPSSWFSDTKKPPKSGLKVGSSPFKLLLMKFGAFLIIQAIYKIRNLKRVKPEYIESETWVIRSSSGN